MSGKDLEGLAALVTGASYGLGQAISEEFVARGAKVMLTDISDRVAGTTEALKAAGGEVDHAFIDVTRRETVKAAIDKAVARFGRLDIFVNNAGWSKSMMLIADITPEDWRTFMDINVMGNLFCIQEASAAMIAGGRGGRYIAIASTAAVKPYKQAAAYCTSKTAIPMLVKVAALEYAPHGITFNTVAPGPTTTETNLAHGSGAIDPAAGEAKRAREARIPLGKNDPVDIATAVAYFASPAARKVTGQLLVVEGGGQLLS